MGDLNWIRSEEKVGNPFGRDDSKEARKKCGSIWGRRKDGWAVSGEG